MIELNEKAVSYAEENVINVLKEAIAKVYADGYRDGYKDRESEIPMNLGKEQVEFVDLGLPSGTLWSADYEKFEGENIFAPYISAQEYNIPTEEQWNELVRHCRLQSNVSGTGTIFYGVTCIGPNGNSIKFRSRGYMKDEIHKGGKTYFWIQNDAENDKHENKAICVDKGIKREPSIDIVQIFSGYKCPIRTVKCNQ